MRKGLRISVSVLLSVMVVVIQCFAGGCASQSSEEGTALPVLLYHHIAETGDGGATISLTRFQEQMQALAAAGYHAVTCAQVVDYVCQRIPLPGEPVLITFDDGYSSNLELAAPVLQENGLCATVFLIGIYAGCENDPTTGAPLYTARFSLEEAAPWQAAEVIELQSHTYDMHQLANCGISGRDGMLRLEGEPEDTWRTAVLTDLMYSSEQLESVGEPMLALAYPYGYFSEETEAFLTEAGVAMSLTVEEGINKLIPGNAASLRQLKRLNVTEHLSGKDLLRQLKRLE